MAIQDTLGPYHSEDLLDPYKIASALNQLYSQIASGGGGGGSSVSSANFIDTTNRISSTTFPAVADGGPAWVVSTGIAVVGDTPCLNFYKRQTANPFSLSSPFPASGYRRSLDLDYWVLQPHGEFWVEQFGAKGRDQADRTDQWQAFEDCKYAILTQPDVQGWAGGVSSEGGVDMRIGRGSYYLSKSHSLEGGTYKIKGSGAHNGGTQIRTPFNVDAFQVQYNFYPQG